MEEGKRYYWLKLREGFFGSKRIKKLRNMAGGDTYTIIYLKMQLLALRSDGVLHWTGLEDNVAEELALDLDEKPEDVEVTLMYLLKTGLAETSDNINFFLPWVVENTGSESASTQRVREYRERQKLLQCNTSETLVKQAGNVEIEKELDKEIELDKRRFIPPTVEEVMLYCQERCNNVDPQAFVDFYESKGWFVGKNKMKDWRAAVRTWEKDKKPQKYVTAENYKPPKNNLSPDEMRKLVDMI